MVDFAKLSAKKRAEKVDKRQLGLFVGQDPGGPQRLVDALKGALAAKSANDALKIPKPKFGLADLSEDQREVYDGIDAWLAGDMETDVFDSTGGKLLTVGGFAGSGKTALTGVFAAEHRDKLTAFATFTGRASSVLAKNLRNAGVETTSLQEAPVNAKSRQLYLDYADHETPFCGTLHKLLYMPVINSKEEVIGWREREEPDREYDLIVVDEASMVGDDMLLDLQRFNIPILAVGDHGQLPPVMASGNLMAKPMLRLRKIHRQAAHNPIIKLSRVVRKTGEFDHDLEDGKHIVFDSKSNIDSVLKKAYRKVESPLDVMLICYTNRQRVRLNLAARKVLGFRGAPSKGELLICLKNMKDANADIYNGMRGVVSHDVMFAGGWTFDCDVAFPEESIDTRTLTLCAPQFNRERVFGSVEELTDRGVDVKTMAGLEFFDWGYALTAHKAQGSQAKHVILWVEEAAKRDESFWKKWLYTCVTRSSDRLTVLL